MFAPDTSEEDRQRFDERNADVEVDEDAPRVRSIWRRCPGENWELLMWWEQPDGGDDPVAPLIQQALAEVRPDALPLTVQPPAEPGVVVGLPAYFSIDDTAAAPSSAAAAAGGFTVTVTVTPTELVIDPGEGEAFSCDPPGSRYQEGQSHSAAGCTHLYETVPDGGSVVVSSYVVYGASYTAEGPGLSATVELPVFEGPTTQTDVAVREVRSVRTR